MRTGEARGSCYNYLLLLMQLKTHIDYHLRNTKTPERLPNVLVSFERLLC